MRHLKTMVSELNHLAKGEQKLSTLARVLTGYSERLDRRTQAIEHGYQEMRIFATKMKQVNTVLSATDGLEESFVNMARIMNELCSECKLEMAGKITHKKPKN